MAATTSSLVGRDTESGLITGERLLEDVDRMIADAVRFGRSMSLAVACLDGDDTAPDSDDVVRVADVLQSGIRTCDLAGRMDDGAFMLVLTATNLSAAVTPLTRLQQAVVALPSPQAGQLQLAVGVASLNGLMSVEDLVVRAIGLADQATEWGPSMMCLDPQPSGASAA